MQKLDARKEDILQALIAEYIRTGEPVSSEDLRKRYRFSFSPATIRKELLLLSDMGYLMQPHTSAGRVPTDAGYRWYVDQLGDRQPAETPRAARKDTEALAGLQACRDLEEFFQTSTELLAGAAHALAIGGVLSNEREPFYKSGFSEVLADPEFIGLEERNHFGALVDSIDLAVRKLAATGSNLTPQVFIGDENPIREARRYSMVVRLISRGGAVGVLAVVGPKRLRYDESLLLLEALENIA